VVKIVVKGVLQAYEKALKRSRFKAFVCAQMERFEFPYG
jgi:hypothetical protein